MSVNHLTDLSHEEFLQMAGTKFEDKRENMMTNDMLRELP